MDKNKQKIAIAEHCGWKYLPKDSYGIQWVTPPKGTQPKKYVPSAPFAPSDVPDYCNDLNAMHEAIMTLSNRQLDDLHTWISDTMTGTDKYMWLLTPQQYAEAFLRTIGVKEVIYK